MSNTIGRLRALTIALLAGCHTDPNAADLDQDGVLNFDDCAPQDPDRFPGNVEVCDGKDNDCDHVVDDGLISTWYDDVDGDGHGDPAKGVETCSPAPGQVQLGDDCDDVVAAIHPGAPELCDDLDNDCANGIDDAHWASDFEPGWDHEIVGLTGDAAVSNDGTNHDLRLVRGQPGLQGGIWLLPRVPGDRWRLRFRMRFSGVGEVEGEGMAFSFVQTEGSPVIGLGAEDLGIYGANVDGWSLEFDVARNGTQDSESLTTHIAFHEIRGAKLLAEQPKPPVFDDGLWHDVDYVQDGGDFTLKIDGIDAWSGSLPINPTGMLTMGFTASTSKDRQMQFAIDDVELACPDTPDEVDSASPALDDASARNHLNAPGRSSDLRGH